MPRNSSTCWAMIGWRVVRATSSSFVRQRNPLRVSQSSTAIVSNSSQARGTRMVFETPYAGNDA
jgi:hypothetical protein